jgi:hypothetical protein
VWVSIVALVLGGLAVLFSLYTYSRLGEKVSEKDIQSALTKSSETVSEDLKRSIRSIEIEWEDMYQKFMRLSGRMDRYKSIKHEEPSPEPPPARLSRQDVLRRWRSSR